jgi:cell division protease FtsH
MAIERIVAGLEKKSRILNALEREIVAHHEMGHALVALALPGTDPVHKVSIIPRGVGALGYTIQRPTEDRFLMTRPELENKMTVLLGGRAAERIMFREVSTGAADDLSKVTEIARSMVMRYGMDEAIGNLAYDEGRSPFLPTVAPPTERNYSEETARRIDEAVRGIVARAFDRAISILERNRKLLEDTAKELLAKETLNEPEIEAIKARVQVPDEAASSGPVAPAARPGTTTTLQPTVPESESEPVAHATRYSE